MISRQTAAIAGSLLALFVIAGVGGGIALASANGGSSPAVTHHTRPAADQTSIAPVTTTAPTPAPTTTAARHAQARPVDIQPTTSGSTQQPTSEPPASVDPNMGVAPNPCQPGPNGQPNPGVHCPWTSPSTAGVVPDTSGVAPNPCKPGPDGKPNSGAPCP